MQEVQKRKEEGVGEEMEKTEMAVGAAAIGKSGRLTFSVQRSTWSPTGRRPARMFPSAQHFGGDEFQQPLHWFV